MKLSSASINLQFFITRQQNLDMKWRTLNVGCARSENNKECLFSRNRDEIFRIFWNFFFEVRLFPCDKPLKIDIKSDQFVVKMFWPLFSSEWNAHFILNRFYFLTRSTSVQMLLAIPPRISLKIFFLLEIIKLTFFHC